MNLDECRKMAKELFIKHGLSDGKYGWEFAFDRSLTRFGLCDASIQFITMSKHMVEINSEHEVKTTLLHEIAHALTPGDGHGAHWAAKCVELGIVPSRCYNTAGNGRAVQQPKPVYWLKCPNCEFKERRFRRTKTRGACPFCCARFNGGKFSEAYVMKYVYA